MAGGAGDHPLTDILHHGASPFGGGLEEKVKEIARRWPEAEQDLAKLIESRWMARRQRRLMREREKIREALWRIEDQYEGPK